MTTIDLSKPIGEDKERVGFQPQRIRTIFIYQCSEGHMVRVLASAFQGRTPVPSVGAIECPMCEFQKRKAS